MSINTVFLAAFRILTGQDVAIDQARTGTIAAAIAWQALQEFGTYCYLGLSLPWERFSMGHAN